MAREDTPPAAKAPARRVLSNAEVMAELSDIAAAWPGGDDALPVKAAEKIRALELLHRYNTEEAERAGADGEQLTIRVVDYDADDA